MWLYAGVPEAPQGTLSGTAGGLPGMRFVLLVEPILTVRLGKMTVQSVAVSQHTLEILCKDVAMNVTLTTSVDSLKHVIARTTAVSLPVDVEHAGKMPTVRLSTIAHSAPVLQTSLEILSPVATPSARDTMTVPLTRLVSSSSAETRVTTQTLTCVDKEPHVRPLITKQCALVQEVTLGTRS